MASAVPLADSASSTAAAAPALLTNWAGNQTFRPRAVHRPTSISELQRLVAGAERVKAVGTLHCFNTIAECDGCDVVALDRLEDVGPPVLDGAASTVTVPAAMTYGALVKFLEHSSFALPNLASLPHISVGGTIATATHGSGVALGCLSTAVVALELVAADGALHRVSRGADADWAGYPVHLGALGVLTRVTLALVPGFVVRQDVYEGLPFDTALARFDEVMSAGYSVSLFTTWRGPLIEQVWRKSAVPAGADGAPEEPAAAMPDEWMGAVRATQPRHPIPGVSGEECTAQLGAPGPAGARLAHFRMEFMPSAGAELQSEFFVARADAPAALAALAALRARIAPLLHISEVRTIAADDLWMSTAYGRDSVAIHFTWKAMDEEVRALLPDIEALLAPFGARAHWGKISQTACAADVARNFPRLADFQRLRRRLDPAGKFGNAFLERMGVMA